MKISNMTSSKGNKVANQFIIEGLPAGTFWHEMDRIEGGRAFQSYESMIAYVTRGGKVYLDSTYYDFSRTTSKYRNEFLNMDTADIKAAIKTGRITLVDLNTGGYNV